MSATDSVKAATKVDRRKRRHPVAHLAGVRLLYGVSTLFIVSIVVFLATQVLPGNAAYSIVGPEASPQALAAAETELHLNRSIFEQYAQWLGGLLHGNPGTSLANQIPVWDFIYPRLINSAVLDPRRRDHRCCAGNSLRRFSGAEARRALRPGLISSSVSRDGATRLCRGCWNDHALFHGVLSHPAGSIGSTSWRLCLE